MELRASARHWAAFCALGILSSLPGREAARHMCMCLSVQNFNIEHICLSFLCILGLPCKLCSITLKADSCVCLIRSASRQPTESRSRKFSFRALGTETDTPLAPKQEAWRRHTHILRFDHSPSRPQHESCSRVLPLLSEGPDTEG